MVKVICLFMISLVMNCASQKIPNWSHDVPDNKNNLFFLSGGYYETASSSKASERQSKVFAIQRAKHKAMENKIWTNIEASVIELIKFHSNAPQLGQNQINRQIKVKFKDFDVDNLPFKEINHKYFEGKDKYYTLVFISFRDIENILHNIIIRELRQYNSESNLEIDFIELEEKLKLELKTIHGNNNSAI